MNAQPKSEVFKRLDEADANFAAQDWWSSRHHDDVGRKAHTKLIMRQLRIRFLANQVSAEFVLKAVDKLQDPLTKKRQEVVGLSVGFKKPGASDVKWFDVAGVIEPTVAVRKAALDPEVKMLVQRGFVLHGTCPIMRWDNKHEIDLDEVDMPSRRVA